MDFYVFILEQKYSKWPIFLSNFFMACFSDLQLFIILSNYTLKLSRRPCYILYSYKEFLERDSFERRRCPKKWFLVNSSFYWVSLVYLLPIVLEKLIFWTCFFNFNFLLYGKSFWKLKFVFFPVVGLKF